MCADADLEEAVRGADPLQRQLNSVGYNLWLVSCEFYNVLNVEHSCMQNTGE